MAQDMQLFAEQEVSLWPTTTEPMKPTLDQELYTMQSALMYNGNYGTAWEMQESGSQLAAQELEGNKRDADFFYHTKLLASLSKGDVEGFKRIQSIRNGLRDNGYQRTADIYGAYADLTLEDKIVEQQAFTHVIAQMATKRLEHTGFTDWAWNFAKDVTTFDKSMDVSQWFKENGISDGSWSSIVSDAKALNLRLNALPFDLRVQELRKIEQELEATQDGDDVRIGMILGLLADPVAMEEDLRMSQTGDAMLLGDLVTMPFPFKLMKLMKNAASVSADLRALDATADILADSVTTGSGRATGMSADELAASTHPIDLEFIFGNSIDGVSNKVADRLQGTLTRQNNTMGLMRRWMTDQDNTLLTERLGTGELNANQQYSKVLQHMADKAADNPKLEYRVVPKDGKIEVWSTEDGWVTQQGIVTKMKKTDDGEFTVTEMSLKDALSQPTNVYDQNLINQSQNILGQSARVAALLTRLQKDAYKPIRGRVGSRKRVHAVIERGDQTQEVYNWDTLVNKGVSWTEKLPDGTKVNRTLKLTPREAEAYFNIRNYDDQMFPIVNHLAWERKAQEGMLTVALEGADNVLLRMIDERGDGLGRVGYGSENSARNVLKKLLGRELTDEDKARIALREDGGYSITTGGNAVMDMDAKPFLKKSAANKALSTDLAYGGLEGIQTRIFDPRVGKTVLATPDVVDEIYDSGYLLTRLEKHFALEDGATAFAVVKSDAVKPLRYAQLIPHKGYAPRIVKDVEFAVFKTTKDGFRKLDRYFKTKLEANKYAAKMGAASSRYKYVPEELRSLTGRDLEEHVIEQFSSPFLGTRTHGRIPIGEGSEMPNYHDPFAAMTLNIDFIAHSAPINTWRHTVEKKWFNTVDAVASKLQVGRSSVLSEPNNFLSPILLDKTNKHRIALEAHRDYIKTMVRLPTEGEKNWESGVRHLAGYLEKYSTGGKKIPGVDWARVFLLNASHTNPFAFARGAAFHQMLGGFNLSQLVVQAAGAFVAMSMNPLSAPKRLTEMLAFSAVRMISHVGPEFDEVLKSVGKASGLGDDFVDAYKAMRKSGMLDTVMQNSDYNAAVRGYGYTRGSIGKLLEFGTIPYKAGETMNLEYTWMQAAANWRKANKGKRLVADKDIQWTFNEARRIGMDMSLTNQTFYQKGILSIPTQFTQVFWKFWGNMMPEMLGGKGKWTAEEKVRVLTTQLILFGTAGVGALVPDSMIAGVERMASRDGFTIDNTTKQTIRQGALGYIASMAGVDLDFAYRLAISGQDNIITQWAIENGGVGADIFGAGGTALGRFAKPAGMIVDMLRSPATTLDNPQVITNALNEVAKMFSSYANHQKAEFLFNTGLYMSRYGVVVDADSSYRGDHIAWLGTMLGFPPTAIGTAYRQHTTLRSIEERERDVIATGSKLIMETIVKVDQSPEIEHEGLWETFRAAFTITAAGHGIDDPQYTNYLFGKVIERLQKDDLQGRTYRRMYNKFANTGHLDVGTNFPQTPKIIESTGVTQ